MRFKNLIMKKYFFLILILSVVSFSFWNCEKDDICPDGTVTTPQLVIEFYDSSVTDSIITLSAIDYFDVTINDTVSESSVSQILVSLNPNEDSVSYELIMTDENDVSATDTITINYTRQNIYVSRACGYKTNFTITDVILNSNNWISSEAIIQPSITNEDEVHLALYY